MLDGKVGQNVLEDLSDIRVLYFRKFGSRSLVAYVDQVIVGHSVHIKGKEVVLLRLTRCLAFSQHPEDPLNEEDGSSSQHPVYMVWVQEFFDGRGSAWGA